MSDPAAVTDPLLVSPLLVTILITVIGGLVTLVFSIIAYMYKTQIERLWKTSNKHQAFIEDSMKDKIKLSELAVQMENIEKSTEGIKEELKEKYDKLLIMMKGIKDLFYNIKKQ